MRCRWCGRDEQEARDGQSTHCNPPFTVQRHKFDGQHPADLREAKMTDQPKQDLTPEQQIMTALKNLQTLAKYTHELAQYRRNLYLEYVAVGFTEPQALELVKGALI